jgi:1,5-anhydro-D-fructose reductase (1,5-anhydro-D-mannitol-forming)
MVKPVRFAILGFGRHAVRRLLPAFARSEQAVVAGMWRRDRVAAQADCREHAIPHCFATAEELCASPEVDVVLITSPDAMHKADTLLALRHGKAVLCEKPLAMNAGEAEEMVAAAERAGLLLGSAQNFRYNHTLDWMREQIAAGRIGTPQMARSEFAYPAHNAPRKWINDPEIACGGPIGDVGVHCIDALRYVLDQDVLSVSTIAQENAPGSRMEAFASMQMAMSGGALATVTVSARAPYRTLVEVTGSDGILLAENGLTTDRPVEMKVLRAGDVLEAKTLNNGDGYVRMIDDFARAYRGESSFRATAQGALHNMRVLDAAYASWRSGHRELI